MLSTRLVPQPICIKPAEPAFTLPTQVCLISEQPANLHVNLLQYTFPHANYLVTQFTTVMENGAVRAAFNRAIYNPNYAGQRLMIENGLISANKKNIYTDTSHIQSITTAEGETAIVIRWIEEGKEIKANNLKEARRILDNPATRESILFLSDKEAIFIPGTIDFGNIDQVQYYAGMRVLYGATTHHPRQYVDFDVIREVATHRELVEKLAIYHDSTIPGHKDVKLNYAPGEIKISIKDYQKTESHIFTKYYRTGLAAIFHLFKPIVSYRHEITDMSATEAFMEKMQGRKKFPYR